MIVKVCGMREPQQMKALENMEVDLMGMIFFPKSPRFVDGEDVCSGCLPKNIRKVGVFVKADLATVVATVKKYNLSFVQLHGGEDVDFANLVKKHTGVGIIKAVSVSGVDDVKNLPKEWESVADYMLFDYKCVGYGGSGQQFDWAVLEDYKLNLPFLLSGGIGPDDAEAVKKVNHPKFAGVDLNSKFEISPANKNIDKVKEFLSKIR
ncbi:MAG: phosphoribosylanthranilate isomerase [Bacteroidales bacterium]|nr:phosphoribosylanthranilate isomerase [Candidatus Scybalocola fimicaballi]